MRRLRFCTHGVLARRGTGLRWVGLSATSSYLGPAYCHGISVGWAVPASSLSQLVPRESSLDRRRARSHGFGFVRIAGFTRRVTSRGIQLCGKHKASLGGTHPWTGLTLSKREANVLALLNGSSPFQPVREKQFKPLSVKRLAL